MRACIARRPYVCARVVRYRAVYAITQPHIYINRQTTTQLRKRTNTQSHKHDHKHAHHVMRNASSKKHVHMFAYTCTQPVTYKLAVACKHTVACPSASTAAGIRTVSGRSLTPLLSGAPLHTSLMTRHIAHRQHTHAPVPPAACDERAYASGSRARVHECACTRVCYLAFMRIAVQLCSCAVVHTNDNGVDDSHLGVRMLAVCACTFRLGFVV
jgi:hypothetical protein